MVGVLLCWLYNVKLFVLATFVNEAYLTGQLGISSCSSTLILDSDEIPAIVTFKAQIRFLSLHIYCYLLLKTIGS